MIKILHVSYDLRDRYNREVTTAISNLINVNVSNFNSMIVDLVRVPNPSKEILESKNPQHLMINVFGLPYGILMTWSQNRAVKFINKAVAANQTELNDCNIIHSHKITFEGLVGYSLSKKLGMPLVLTLRQTDTMVFNKNPGAVELFKPVIRHCQRIFYLIPQILVRMRNIFGEEFYNDHVAPKVVFLPNIVEREISNEEVKVERGLFVTVLRMTKKSVQRKNLKRLLLAFKSVQRNNVKLKIIGDGEYRSVIEQWVSKFGLDEKVMFEGTVENDKIDTHFMSAEALLLPSISETFGMVYAESLLNGSPIMYSKNYLGFDGFFEGVGAGVDPMSVDSIREGIEDLYDNGSKYRMNIESLKNADEFRVFTRDYIREKYNSTIMEVVEAKE